MKAKITFNPQAWHNDYAIDVDPEGPTTFTVDASHLQQFDADALKYELEPYMEFPQTPQWIKEWRGPFFIEVKIEDDKVLLHEEGDGVYSYDRWSVQNPNLMDRTDPDKSWYAMDEQEGETLGPFDTLDEVRHYLYRYDTIDEWRGSVCEALRETGYGFLADEFGGVSDQEAMTHRDANEDPAAAARIIAGESRLPPEEREFEVEVETTFSYRGRVRVRAVSEEEAQRRGLEQYEKEYDPAAVGESFAMEGGFEGEHRVTEVHELDEA